MQLAPEKIPYSERLWLQMNQATQIYGVGRTTLYNDIRAGKIESIKINKRRLLGRPSLDRRFAPQE